MDYNVEKIKKNGWRQGSVLPCALHECVAHVKLFPISAPDEDSFFIVISQSCDVTHRDLNNEPVCELLLARKSSKDGRVFYGKNPRTMQFVLGDLTYQVNARDVFFIDRKLLANYVPRVDIILPLPSVISLVRWKGKRYTRPAFPDSFGERVGRKLQALEGIFSKNISLSRAVAGFYVLVTDEELPAERDYEIELLMVLHSAVKGWDDKVIIEGESEDILRQLEDEFDNASGVVVTNWQRIYSDSFSYDAQLKYRPLILDDISIRHGDLTPSIM